MVLDGLVSSMASPYQLTRSTQLVIPTKVTLTCSQNYTVQKYWSFTQIYQNGSSIGPIQLSSATVNLSELTIDANTLSYGFYMASYTYTVSIFNLSNVVVEAQTSVVSAYIQVVPTGLVIQALSSGVQSLSIGTEQLLSLEPKTYSYDPDGLISPVNLTFFYYYRVNNNGITGNYSLLDLTNQNTSLSKLRINKF